MCMVKNSIPYTCYVLVLFSYMCFVLSCSLVVVACVFMFHG